MNWTYIITGALIGLLIGGYFGYRKSKEIVVTPQQNNKSKILVLLAQKEKITNDDVQELLGVSDATATRYLDQLEKVGKIEQVGETGVGVYYKLK